MARYIAAIDQGTTSTRCALVDVAGGMRMVQREHRQIYPRPGWVEHDPQEIWQNVVDTIVQCCHEASVRTGDIVAVGITNQRETTVVWDRVSGRALYNAIVWQDTRTQDICDSIIAQAGHDAVRGKTGLPVATYFSAPKIRWMLDHVPGVQRSADAGTALVGTMESYLIWQLTGGPDGGVHVSDVTNASRTLLMSLRTCQWDDELIKLFGIPKSMLPTIVASSHRHAMGRTRVDGPFGASIPITGALGDQHAALMGQACFETGSCKNTYGTGCFMLMNTGTEPVWSESGLLTTVGYQLQGERPVYALEGSIAVTGSLVRWLRDQLGIISSSDQVETLARQVPDNGDVYFVPAFSGLFAPYWRSDARGLIVGLTGYSTKAHIARAALESVAFQNADVLCAMQRDAGVVIGDLRVDGGMTVNDLLMQFQADVLGAKVTACRNSETTVMGAAYAAGLGAGFWENTSSVGALWRAGRSWTPAMDASQRARLMDRWHEAVRRSFGWRDSRIDL